MERAVILNPLACIGPPHTGPQTAQAKGRAGRVGLLARLQN